MNGAGSSSRWWWLGPALCFLLLTIVAVLIGGAGGQSPHGTSYDASPEGFRAAYLLLDELGYPVVRSKRVIESAVKIVAFPQFAKKDVDVLGRWVQDGGLLILADDGQEFAQQLGVTLEIRSLPGDPDDEPAEGWGVERLAGGIKQVSCPGQQGRVEVTAGGKPFITVHRMGRGEIWLANRPEFFKNRQVRRADNSMLICRLAEEVLQRRSGKLAFDEYFHGMRDRPGATELMLQPPALWVTLQGVVLLGLLMWHYVPKFGTPRPDTTVQRRSKEEFLGAMAALLERKGDYAESYRTVREDLLRDMEQELGLASGAPVDPSIEEALRRERIRPDLPLERLRGGDSAAKIGRDDFLAGMNDLQTIRDEFFNGRHHR